MKGYLLEAEVNNKATLVAVFPGMYVPSDFTVPFEPAEGDARSVVTFRIEFDEAAQRFRCTSISGDAITDGVMREISVTTIVADAVAREQMPGTKRGAENEDVRPLMREHQRDPEAFVAKHPRDDVLAVLAAWYRFAYMVGKNPAKTVMNQLRLPRSTASRWIAEARENGLLGTTKQGKAGI